MEELQVSSLLLQSTGCWFSSSYYSVEPCICVLKNCAMLKQLCRHLLCLDLGISKIYSFFQELIYLILFIFKYLSSATPFTPPHPASSIWIYLSSTSAKLLSVFSLEDILVFRTKHFSILFWLFQCNWKLSGDFFFQLSNNLCSSSSTYHDSQSLLEFTDTRTIHFIPISVKHYYEVNWLAFFS